MNTLHRVRYRYLGPEPLQFKIELQDTLDAIWANQFSEQVCRPAVVEASSYICVMYRTNSVEPDSTSIDLIVKNLKKKLLDLETVRLENKEIVRLIQVSRLNRD